VNSSEFDALEMLKGWLVDRRDLDFSYHPTHKLNRYFMRENRGKREGKGTEYVGTYISSAWVWTSVGDRKLALVRCS